MGDVKAYFERKRKESQTKFGETYYKNIFTVIVSVIVILVGMFFVYCAREIIVSHNNTCDMCESRKCYVKNNC
jgi:hypothetical protein